LHKIDILRGDMWVEHSFAPTFQRQELDSGASRIFAGVPHSDPIVFSTLVSCVTPPYSLLYVLHTPRGEGEPGRYQSPEISANEFRTFMSQFGKFLSMDSRFDLWALSKADSATVVWDRHNQMYAYGPLEAFARELRALGFSEEPVQIFKAHQHHYHADLDLDARALIAAFSWTVTPLREQDEQ
jgi:hypothetical protein